VSSPVSANFFLPFRWTITITKMLFFLEWKLPNKMKCVNKMATNEEKKTNLLLEDFKKGTIKKN
jgi:hypothetical protein